MVEDYSKLKIAELLRLLEDGDIKAKQTLDGHYAELRQKSIEEKMPIFLEVYQIRLSEQQLVWLKETQDPWFIDARQNWVVEKVLGQNTTKFISVEQMTIDWSRDNREFKYWRNFLNRNLQDDFHLWLKSFLDSFPAESAEALARDFGRFIDGDIEAGKKLARNHYSKGRIFFPKRLEQLRNYIDLRHSEENLDADEEIKENIWWIEKTVLAALALVLKSPEFNDFSFSIPEIYSRTRRQVGLEIEKDLMDGITTTKMERYNISFTDKYGSEGSGNNIYEVENPDNEIEEEIEEEKIIIEPFLPEDSIDLELEENKFIAVTKIIKDLSPQKIKILMKSEYGDTETLSKELGKTPGAIRTIRSRIIQKIRKEILR